MLLPRELDMIAAGKHMPLPVPKPNVAELVELNKQEQGKVDSADEDWRRQVWTRKPAPPDCASGSGIDCGNKSVPPVAAMSKEHLPTMRRRPTGPNQEQRQQQQAQPGMQGRGPAQLQQPGIQSRGPPQKQQPQATTGRGPQQRQQQAAIERRGSPQKQKPPGTDGRGG
jgi:hypothetical protein